MKLHRLIAQYVAFRKGLGAKFEANQAVLNAFCRAAGKDRYIGSVKARQVKTFLDGHGPVTRYWHRKYIVLRSFFSYAQSRGYLQASPLPTTVPKLPERFKPYIYSREDVRRLLESTGSAQSRRFQMDARTFRALLLLLYGAGLRISEALSLTLDDVDLQQGVIIVRDTKFYKTRVVPLEKELNAVMVEHAQRRKETGRRPLNGAPFFATALGTRLGRRLLERNFQRLRTLAGVHREDGASYQPRLHDLRHTAAVHRLTAWYREGQDVQRLLPLLSTYLGHSSIACTQIYLTVTPDVLRESNKRFARYVFGEAGHD
jgi:integrase/recombinase XerD